MKRKIAPGVVKTLYPIGWDPTCSNASFNEWQQYIRDSLAETYHINSKAVIAERYTEERNRNTLLWEAKKIISK
ncbi:Uncharacterised protein [Sphingobacterium spiritivorum]|uniref:Uncharacterized protein n=1 Tax=Sphingobacterium spiritivorum TaxID=258 RepID=A0A380CDT6_SPHSI|nr:hypothetical protein [Sphingobacterium spiritivorum]SUJ18488.1 Uncharacterised protein [Sphingobacterium spiritivorum]